MNPLTLAKSNTEHAHQRAFFAWVNMVSRFGFEAGLAMEAYTNPAYHRDILQAVPGLALMHAIPNGGLRSKATAGKLKAEGVKSGVLDTFLPWPAKYKYPTNIPFSINDEASNVVVYEEGWYCGLYVEFKKPEEKTRKDGGLSPAQVEFMDAARNAGYCCRVAYNWAEAANLVMLYLDVELRFTNVPDYATQAKQQAKAKRKAKNE